MDALRIAPLRVASAVSALDACSFCGRREHEADVMLRGVIAWACDVCVDDLSALLAARRASHVHVHVRRAHESAPVLTPAAPFSKAAVTQEDGHVVRSAGAHPHSAPAEQPRGTTVQTERGDGEACAAVAEPPADDPLPAPLNSADQANTAARPGTSPRVQDTALPENGRNDPFDATAGITGAPSTVQKGPCVATTGAGDEVGASRDPAPASDRPARKGPLSDPAHVVTPGNRKLICAEYGVDDDRFEDFRAGVFEGLSHDDAAARVSTLVEA